MNQKPTLFIDYWWRNLFRTCHLDTTPHILVYALVDSVDDYLKKIFAAGRSIVVLKRAIPGVGYYA